MSLVDFSSHGSVFKSLTHTRSHINQTNLFSINKLLLVFIGELEIRIKNVALFLKRYLMSVSALFNKRCTKH